MSAIVKEDDDDDATTENADLLSLGVTCEPTTRERLGEFARTLTWAFLWCVMLPTVLADIDMLVARKYRHTHSDDDDTTTTRQLLWYMLTHWPTATHWIRGVVLAIYGALCTVLLCAIYQVLAWLSARTRKLFSYTLWATSVYTVPTLVAYVYKVCVRVFFVGQASTPFTALSHNPERHMKAIYAFMSTHYTPVNVTSTTGWQPGMEHWRLGMNVCAVVVARVFYYALALAALYMLWQWSQARLNNRSDVVSARIRRNLVAARALRKK